MWPKTDSAWAALIAALVWGAVLGYTRQGIERAAVTAGSIAALQLCVEGRYLKRALEDEFGPGLLHALGNWRAWLNIVAIYLGLVLVAAVAGGAAYAPFRFLRYWISN